MYLFPRTQKALSLLFMLFLCFCAGTALLASSIKKTGAAFFDPVCRYSEAVTKELSDSLLRFRVLANSDSPADQQQKQYVSSGLVRLLCPALSRAANKAEAAAVIENSLPFLTAYAQYLADQYQEGCQVSCSLGMHLFPYKSYGGYAFPAGEYETLLVTIGSGKGSNWWCLAFPPLCFTREAFAEVPESSSETLEQLLSAETLAGITAGSSKKESRRFTFRLLPFLNSLLD